MRLVRQVLLDFPEDKPIRKGEDTNLLWAGAFQPLAC